MSESNGVDLGQIAAMLQTVIVAQDRMQVELKSELATMAHRLGNLERRFDSLEHRFDNLERRFDNLEQKVSSLQQAVESYHHTVIGHGILISELDARTIRVETHLNLPPMT